MKYRTLPGTHLKVSEVGFGVEAVTAGWAEIREEEVHHLLRYALDRGINFFDLATSDGDGRGEDLGGGALSEERDRVVIATQFGYREDLSPKYVRASCEESLKRLRTDRIDLYQIHHPRLTAVEQEDLYDTLERLKKKGKILSWGARLGPAVKWYEEGSLLVRFRKAKSLQMNFGLLEQEPGRDLLNEGRRFGVGFFIRSSIPPAGENGRNLEKLGFLVRPDRTLGQAVLKFVLSEPSVVSVLPDISSEDHINEYAAACECPDLTVEELKRITDLFSREKVWMTKTASF